MKNLFSVLAFILTFCSFANSHPLKTHGKHEAKFESFAKSTNHIQFKSNYVFNSFAHTPSMFVGVDWNCLVASIQVYNAYTNIGMNPREAQQIANGVYLGCTGQLPGR
uniref:hypothetical protein n=1 Tax=Flavobacterium sp. TaxID=239 RepID=UPI00404B81A7